jgi:hypothetical protein
MPIGDWTKETYKGIDTRCSDIYIAPLKTMLKNSISVGDLVPSSVKLN